MLGDVVVLGGCGFIGSNLVESLVDKCKRVIVLDNRTSGSHEIPGVVYITGDSWDIFKHLNEYTPELLFHFAEFSRVVPSFEHIDYVWKSNSLGTQQVLEYCVEKGTKLIYSGSSAIFGDEMKDANLSPYAFLKAHNVQLIKNYAEWFGLKYAICYFYNAYGPRDVADGVYATCIARFRKQYADGQPLTVVSPGTQRRVWTHVSDIVSGLLLVAEHGEGDGYKLFSSDDYSIFEVVRLFGQRTVRFTIVPERRGERFESTTGNSRASDELGWKAQNSLSNYIKLFAEEHSPYRAALGYPPMTSQKGESYHCTAGFRAHTDESAGDTS